MEKNRFSTVPRILPFISLALIIFTGLAFKAGTSSFTHDESLSYIKYVFTGDVFAIGDANNHLLNSIMMYCSSVLFGVSEFSLRLPNLMAYLGYAFFTYKILHSVKNLQVRLLGFFMLNAIPFVLDFFALARGYGLAISLFMGNIYFLTCFVNSRKLKHLFYALLMISLASFAVMTMVYFVAFLLILAVYMMLSKYFIDDKAGKRQIGIIIICDLIALIFIANMGISLKSQGSLYVGGTSFLSSLISLVNNVLYHELKLLWIVVGFFLLLLSLFTASIYVQVKREGLLKFLGKPFGLYSSLMLFCAVAMIVQHIALGTNYPPERAIQFFIPIFVLMLIHWLDQLPKIPRRVMSVSLAILVSLNFVNGANLEETFIWRYDADTKEHYQYISEYGDDEMTVAVHPLYRPTFNFYNLINHTNVFAIQDASPEHFADYVINDNLIGFESCEVISEKSHSYLLKNNQVKREWNAIIHYEIADTSHPEFMDTDSEYLLLKKYDIPDSITESTMLYVEFTGSTPTEELLTAHVVVADDGEGLYIKGLLSHHIVRPGIYEFGQGFWLSPEAMAGKTVKIYVWNLERQVFSLSDLNIKWYIPEIEQ